MAQKNTLIVIYCSIDIFLPFIGFFIFLDTFWPYIFEISGLNSQGWLVGPMAIVLLAAIVFMYIVSERFPNTGREQWRLIRSSLLALSVLLVSSGSNWMAGVFQYSLFALIALVCAFGSGLVKQHSVVGWIFGGIALLWTMFASWISYRFYVATFVISWEGIIWIVWPLWLLVVFPQIKKRYRLIDSFF